MDHLCECGEEVIIHVRKDDLATYCPSCGVEGTLPKPKGAYKKEPSNLVPITRAALLKKMNDAKAIEASTAKKPKQLRDRSDYKQQRRAR